MVLSFGLLIIQSMNLYNSLLSHRCNNSICSQIYLPPAELPLPGGTSILFPLARDSSPSPCGFFGWESSLADNFSPPPLAVGSPDWSAIVLRPQTTLYTQDVSEHRTKLVKPLLKSLYIQTAHDYVIQDGRSQPYMTHKSKTSIKETA